MLYLIIKKNIVIALAVERRINVNQIRAFNSSFLRKKDRT